MKNVFYIILAITLGAGCKGKSDQDKLAALLSEQKTLTKEMDEKKAKLDKLNEEISKIQKVEKIEPIVPETISYQVFEHAISLQSSVSTDQDVMIYPEYAGTLTWKVKEGQRVSAGQIIGHINDGGMSSQLQQVKIQADLARTSFEKQQRLWNEKIGSEIQYLQAKATYEAAQKSIAAMQSQLSRTNVKAPFSGTIDNLIMQTGQAVAPGVPLGKIVNQSNMKVLADVSESYISKIKVGTPVVIDLIGLNQTMQARVTRVSSSMNPTNRSFQIEIPIENRTGSIKPNMTANLKIIDYNNKNAIVVPNSAVQVNASGQNFVYTLGQVNGKSAIATKAMITIGQQNENNTEVLSGLKVGDIIVKEGSKTVVAGTKLTF